MQPITRINANDPVIFSDMNLRFNEIEARDNEQQEQINVLKSLNEISYTSPDLLNGCTTDVNISIVKHNKNVFMNWYGLKRPTSAETIAFILPDGYKPYRDLVFTKMGINIRSTGEVILTQDNLGYDGINYMTRG